MINIPFPNSPEMPSPACIPIILRKSYLSTSSFQNEFSLLVYFFHCWGREASPVANEEDLCQFELLYTVSSGVAQKYFASSEHLDSTCGQFLLIFMVSFRLSKYFSVTFFALLRSRSRAGTDSFQHNTEVGRYECECEVY